MDVIWFLKLLTSTARSVSQALDSFDMHTCLVWPWTCASCVLFFNSLSIHSEVKVNSNNLAIYLKLTWNLE